MLLFSQRNVVGWQTSGVLPAALTVATATEISAADKGSNGWLLCALTMIGIPAIFFFSDWTSQFSTKVNKGTKECINKPNNTKIMKYANAH